MISVIVSVYNTEKYLDDCVESILAQTYGEFELLLINDGSGDGSGIKCDEWAKKDPRIQVIHKENGGIASVRNVGLSIARGDYIAWVDSDDYVDSRFLEMMLGRLQEENADMVVCSLFADRDGKITSEGTEHFANAVYEWESFMEKVYTYGLYSVVWNKLVRKSAYNNVVFPEGKLFEDSSVMRTLARNCKKIIVMDAQLYYYRRHNQCITMKKRDYQDELHYVEQFLGWIIDDIKFYKEEMNEKLSAYASRHLCDAIIIYSKRLNYKDARKLKELYHEHVSTIIKSKYIGIKSKAKYCIVKFGWTLLWCAQKVVRNER